MIDKEFLRKSGAVIVGLLLFFIYTMFSEVSITGYFGFSSDPSPIQMINIGFILLLIAIITLFFILVNKGNLKEMFKNMLGALAIYIGLYSITKIISNLDIIITMISLTFGIMAIIWVLKARGALSKGSSLRAYTTSFLFCVVFILLFSIYDSYIKLFDIKGNVVYMKYFLITLVYIVIVYTSYKIYILGTEFGFAEEGARVKKALKKR